MDQQGIAGTAVQVTRNGGYVSFESPDGKLLWYARDEKFRTSLWKMPVNGGEESQVLESVSWLNFFVVDQGIYFIPAPSREGKFSIQFLTFATGAVKTIATLPNPAHLGITVSPDGRFLLYSQVDQSGSNLMLVENFR